MPHRGRIMGAVAASAAVAAADAAAAVEQIDVLLQ